jgi:hypothetical protein
MFMLGGFGLDVEPVENGEEYMRLVMVPQF